ncbi:transmembrane protein, putative (macronuclear) [Tetrahymena thermophila SB210]|uniref:Transmembrane protein, putative n=1 Tax=Tetrahymena thermophila (strain SB210) TaxID=312017 RepID=Q23NE2_TETTS|nr:transmembrane protein, putative [Tetrahymena thermophila SB210]EAR98040.1 transmembrane protein, putative [Tetrahymena thermophila SB210]|eukprot:XP_001018285.1 transmembrane protein, putative [Tetrahymena thermophila SB210]
MRFIAVCLFALVALSSVYADDIEKMKCLGQVPKPCGDGSDSACLTAYNTDGNCVNRDCAAKLIDLNDYATCIKKCKSNNDKVQKWIDANVSCVGSGLLSFAALMIAFVAFMF